VVRRLAEAGRVESFSPAETVFARGETVSGWRAFSQKGVELHVVLTGGADGQHERESHGNLSRVTTSASCRSSDGEPRSADVVASTDGMTTFAMSKWQFDDLLQEHPHIAIPSCASWRAGCGPPRRALP